MPSIPGQTCRAAKHRLRQIGSVLGYMSHFVNPCFNSKVKAENKQGRQIGDRLLYF
jgi:hypothetical protein